jgi:predicted transcriptional regulator
MEIQFPPEMEERLNHLAIESGRGKVQLVVEMVASQLSYDAWFRREVEKGIASLDRGEFVEHAEVGRRMESIFGA